MTEQTLLARVDRLESLDEIRQLAAKYQRGETHTRNQRNSAGNDAR